MICLFLYNAPLKKSNTQGCGFGAPTGGNCNYYNSKFVNTSHMATGFSTWARLVSRSCCTWLCTL